MAETILWLNIDPSTVPQKQSKSTRYRLWDSPIILSRSTPGNYDVILIIVVPSEMTGSCYHLWTYVNSLVSLHLGLGNNAASPRILLFKKKYWFIFMYLIGRKKRKGRDFFTCWLTPQMPLLVKAVPEWSQEPWVWSVLSWCSEKESSSQAIIFHPPGCAPAEKRTQESSPGNSMGCRHASW